MVDGRRVAAVGRAGDVGPGEKESDSQQQENHDRQDGGGAARRTGGSSRRWPFYWWMLSHAGAPRLQDSLKARLVREAPERASLVPVLIAVVAAGVVLTGLSGCARYPAVTSGATASLLTVSLQVNSTQDAQINPNYYYFIALQASPDATVSGADPSLGPFAVFQAGSGVTWGNGWGTGKISDYVLYHAGVAQQFSIDVSDPSTYLSNVINNSQVPNPVSAVPRSFSLSPDGKNLSITIDTSSLGLNAGKTPTRTPPGGVVLNVITTDKVPVGQENAVPVKAVDSLEGGGIVVLPDNTTEPLSGLPQLDLHQQKTIEIRPTGRVQDPGASDPVRLQDLQMTDIVVNVQPG